jgi:uncharacterized protein involved in cysteine biosynthesis
MSAVPAALVKAFGQLADRAVVMVAVKSIGITLVLFVALGFGLYLALASAARPLPLRREVALATRGLLRALGYNLLALPLAAVLAFTAIGPAVVFLLVNAVLLGGELTDMAWLRHCGGDVQGNPAGPAERLLLGGAIAGMMLVPLAGFIAPVIGAAAGTHLVLRRLSGEAQA